MTHNQLMTKATNEGKEAAKTGNNINPYHVCRETAYHQAWQAAYNQAK